MEMLPLVKVVPEMNLTLDPTTGMIGRFLPWKGRNIHDGRYINQHGLWIYIRTCATAGPIVIGGVKVG